MRLIGIDPGMSGAACLLDPGGAIELTAIDLPTMGESSKREIDAASLFDWVRAQGAEAAIIENVTAMPSIPGADGMRRGMGAASAFRFGMGVGAVRAVVAAAKVPVVLVVPAVWKKHFALKGGDKEPSRQLAIRQWPRHADLFRRKLDHQRAEAALIAFWGWRKLNGKLGGA